MLCQVQPAAALLARRVRRIGFSMPDEGKEHDPDSDDQPPVGKRSRRGAEDLRQQWNIGDRDLRPNHRQDATPDHCAAQSMPAHTSSVAKIRAEQFHLAYADGLWPEQQRHHLIQAKKMLKAEGR